MKHRLLNTIFLFLLCACQKENVEIPDTGRKIVINGLFTTDSLINVRITRSEYYKSKVYLYNELDRAIVQFYKNDIPIDSLHYLNNGNDYGYLYYNGGDIYSKSNYWSDNVYPMPGNEYQIKVTNAGYPEATATTRIPRLVKIEKVDTSRIDVNGSIILNCKIEFTDPAAEKNYYLFNIITIRMFPWWRSYLAFDSQDPVIEEKLCSTSGGRKYGFAFSDKLIDGKKYSLNILLEGTSHYINDTFPKTSYVYYFRLISITEDYFKFIKTLNLFNATRWDPLAEPVMVYSNVSGGYGIFAGAAVSTDSIILHD